MTITIGDALRHCESNSTPDHDPSPINEAKITAGATDMENGRRVKPLVLNGLPDDLRSLLMT